MVENLTEAGADVVIAQKGIDDMAQHYLAQEGILAVRRAKVRHQGALPLDGRPRRLEHRRRHRRRPRLRRLRRPEGRRRRRAHLRRGRRDAKAVTLILRGGTEHVVDGSDAPSTTRSASSPATLEDGKVLPGGGAPRPNWPSACATTPTPSAAAAGFGHRGVRRRHRRRPANARRERRARSHRLAGRPALAARRRQQEAPASTPTPARSST